MKFKYYPLYLFSLLPLVVLYRISSFLYWLIYRILTYRKKVVLANLRNAFPKDHDDQIEKKASDFYKHFADLLVESLKTASLSNFELDQRFVYKNIDVLRREIVHGKSIILYTAHLGNWEWFAGITSHLKCPVYSLYLPLSNRYMNGWMISLRERFGLKTLSASKAFRYLLQRSLSGEKYLSFFIGDQSPPNIDHVHWIDFLNQHTAFLPGTSNMALKLQASVYFPFILKTSRGQYTIEFVCLWDGLEPMTAEQITHRYAHWLEKAIQKSPAIWLWSHRRWKLQPNAT